MFGKGVDYYVYNTSPYTVEVQAFNCGSSAPEFSRGFNNDPRIQTGNVQINYKVSTSLTGSFVWTTSTTPSVSKAVDINPITGNMSGSLEDMMNTPSALASQYAVSYGFYDAGSGLWNGLTNQDQAYVYLTPAMSDWMGQLAGQYSQVGSNPLSQFALPGAHDAGSFDMTTVQALLAVPAIATAFLGGLGLAAGAQALTAITSLSATQKENITSMLNLGCRYFDFRPGYAMSPLNSVATGIYHQHTFVPGYPFQSFLTDVLNWLAAHPGEIVVVGANSQGFQQPQSMTPSDSALAAILSQAKTATGSTIAIGTASDLSTSYGDLLAANKRLIFLNQIGNWYPAKKYDSYNPSYATTQPQPIMAALKGMNSSGQSGNDYTILQLQGTASDTGGAAQATAVTTLSKASSLLMSTKAFFDSNTYPWLVESVSKNLSNGQLVVFINDFFDNALAQSAMTITKQRMGLS